MEIFVCIARSRRYRNKSHSSKKLRLANNKITVATGSVAVGAGAAATTGLVMKSNSQAIIRSIARSRTNLQAIGYIAIDPSAIRRVGTTHGVSLAFLAIGWRLHSLPLVEVLK